MHAARASWAGVSQVTRPRWLDVDLCKIDTGAPLMWTESDRRRTLIEAHRSRTRGDERRAISLYKRILREEPDNFEVAVRVAPLLAGRGEGFDAWQLYRGAARQLARARRYKDCLAIYTKSEFRAVQFSVKDPGGAHAHPHPSARHGYNCRGHTQRGPWWESWPD